MKEKPPVKEPTILEAVDNLSSMAELDPTEFSENKKKKNKIGLRLAVGRWYDLQDEQKSVDSVKNTFRVVHDYLKHLYAEENKTLKEEEVQKGIRSIMALASEAAQKIDQCTNLFKKKGSLKDSKEYKELVEFYEQKMLKRFEEVMAEEAEWAEVLAKEEDITDIKQRGIKDLESVTRDRDYELFHITKEDGTKFYNKNLARHIRLVADFDQIIGNLSGEDPLLKVKVLLDRNIFSLCRFIKGRIEGELNEWMKVCGKFREDSVIQNVHRAFLALLLASNPKNLLSEVSGKGCSSYFADFQYYLRLVLEGADYLNLLGNASSDNSDFYERTTGLLHRTCYAIFSYPNNYADALALLTRIVEKDSSAEKTSKRSSLSIWNHLLDFHEHLNSELRAFPSGPLFKILDILHAETPPSFDPYMIEDRPTHLFTLCYPSSDVKVLRCASPTMQVKINQATIIPEFYAFLRQAKVEKERWLFVDLQDRTSWKEFARAQAIEELQADAEFKDTIHVMTLPKNTDFYLQSEEYSTLSDSADFKKVFLAQVNSRQECGYFFPKHFKGFGISSFAKESIEMIHSVFFGGKKVLSRKNRLDFIEIFYYLLIMKIVEELKATHLVFMAKDTVDIAASESAGIYAFLKILSEESDWKEEEKDFLTALFFVPALLIRERTIDIKPFNRTISMLSVISGELELDQKKVNKAVRKILPKTLSKMSLERSFTYKKPLKRGRRSSKGER